MAKRDTTTKATGDLESRVTSLEARVAALETQALKQSKVVRRKREYTEEQRAAIRARLLAGQEAARKRRENEAQIKTTQKADSSKAKRPKKVIEAEESKQEAEPVPSSGLS